MLKSDISESEKHATILDFDRVLDWAWTRSTNPGSAGGGPETAGSRRRRVQVKDFKARTA